MKFHPLLALWLVFAVSAVVATAQPPEEEPSEPAYPSLVSFQTKSSLDILHFAEGQSLPQVDEAYLEGLRGILQRKLQEAKPEEQKAAVGVIENNINQEPNEDLLGLWFSTPFSAREPRFFETLWNQPDRRAFLVRSVLPLKHWAAVPAAADRVREALTTATTFYEGDGLSSAQSLVDALGSWVLSQPHWRTAVEQNAPLQKAIEKTVEKYIAWVLDSSHALEKPGDIVDHSGIIAAWLALPSSGSSPSVFEKIWKTPGTQIGVTALITYPHWWSSKVFPVYFEKATHEAAYQETLLAGLEHSPIADNAEMSRKVVEHLPRKGAAAVPVFEAFLNTPKWARYDWVADRVLQLLQDEEFMEQFCGNDTAQWSTRMAEYLSVWKTRPRGVEMLIVHLTRHDRFRDWRGVQSGLGPLIDSVKQDWMGHSKISDFIDALVVYESKKIHPDLPLDEYSYAETKKLMALPQVKKMAHYGVWKQALGMRGDEVKRLLAGASHGRTPANE